MTDREPQVPPAYLVVDTESVPDGKLLGQVRFADESLSAEEAVARAQAEARAQSQSGSDFLPVTFQYPVAVCVLRVGADFTLQALTCLDAPEFRPRRFRSRNSPAIGLSDDRQFSLWLRSIFEWASHLLPAPW